MRRFVIVCCLLMCLVLIVGCPEETEEILISDSFQLEERAVHEVSFFVQSGQTIVVHVTAQHPIAWQHTECHFATGGIGSSLYLNRGQDGRVFAFKWFKDCSLERIDGGWLLEMICKVDETGYYELMLMNYTGEPCSGQYVVSLRY